MEFPRGANWRLSENQKEGLLEGFHQVLIEDTC